MSKRKSYHGDKLPVWVARIHEVVRVKGKTYLNVTTRTGKPRTLRVKR